MMMAKIGEPHKRHPGAWRARRANTCQKLGANGLIFLLVIVAKNGLFHRHRRQLDLAWTARLYATGSDQWSKHRPPIVALLDGAVLRHYLFTYACVGW